MDLNLTLTPLDPSSGVSDMAIVLVCSYIAADVAGSAALDAIIAGDVFFLFVYMREIQLATTLRMGVCAACVCERISC